MTTYRVEQILRGKHPDTKISILAVPLHPFPRAYCRRCNGEFHVGDLVTEDDTVVGPLIHQTCESGEAVDPEAERRG